MYRALAAAVALCAVLAVLVSAQAGYEFADGVEDIVRNIDRSFSCDNRPYGYYADVASQCQIFHICFPIQDATGATIDTVQYSFFCGNETIFDQMTLTCNYPVDAAPCEEAESLYTLRNSEFFQKIDSTVA